MFLFQDKKITGKKVFLSLLPTTKHAKPKQPLL
jgi:hypothetical protein